MFPENVRASYFTGRYTSPRKRDLVRVCQEVSPPTPAQPWAFYVEKGVMKRLTTLDGTGWITVSVKDWVGVKAGRSHPCWCHWRLRLNCSLVWCQHVDFRGTRMPIIYQQVAEMATLTDVPQLGYVNHQPSFAYPSESHVCPPSGLRNPKKSREVQRMLGRIASTIGNALGLPTAPPANVFRGDCSGEPAFIEPEEIAL